MRVPTLAAQSPHFERDEFGTKRGVAVSERHLVLVNLGDDGFCEVPGDGEERRVVRDLRARRVSFPSLTPHAGRTHGDQQDVPSTRHRRDFARRATRPRRRELALRKGEVRL